MTVVKKILAIAERLTVYINNTHVSKNMFYLKEIQVVSTKIHRFRKSFFLKKIHKATCFQLEPLPCSFVA